MKCWVASRFMAGLLAIAPLPAVGQTSRAIGNEAISEAATEEVAGSALQFQKTIDTLRKQLLERHDNPYPGHLADLLMQRLRGHLSVTVETVHNVLEAMGSYESKLQLQNVKDISKIRFIYPRTKKLIDAALPLAEGLPRIQNELLTQKGDILTMERDFKGSARIYQQALDVISPLRLKIDLSRIQSLCSMASAYTLTGQKIPAEKAYRMVLSYDWYKVADPHMQGEFVDRYLEAGRAMIQLSRHDLKALHNLFFIPSTMDELGPMLKKAIKEATEEAKHPLPKPSPDG